MNADCGCAAGAQAVSSGGDRWCAGDGAVGHSSGGFVPAVRAEYFLQRRAPDRDLLSGHPLVGEPSAAARMVKRPVSRTMSLAAIRSSGIQASRGQIPDELHAWGVGMAWEPW